MSKRVYLYSDTPSNENWQYQVTSSLLTGAQSTVRGSLDQILEAANEDQMYCLLLPGTDISLFEVKLPENNQRKFIAAIGYTLEGQLAEDINDIHITSLNNAKNNTVAVACINHQQLSAWLSCHVNSNQVITSALPITSVLPIHDDGITVVVTDTLTHVKTTPTTGYSIENNLVISSLLNNESNASTSVHCYDVTQSVSFYTQLCDELTSSGRSIVDHGKSHSLLDLQLLAPSDSAHGNILHGKHAAKPTSPLTRYWKVAAIFIALFLCVETLYVLIEKSRLETKITTVNNAIETSFRESFPDIKRVVNPKIQMRNGIVALKNKSSQSNSTFNQLLNHSASVLHNTPGITVSGYQFKNSHLTYDVTAKSIEAVSNAQKLLARNNNIKAKLINARTENKRVTGQVEVELSS
ncbi:MAG: hypothetical protein JKY93_04400 [Gammaproteobacteria bacterium]|nr:hypothetical protein [Gammaproteobacteria bacterium]